MCVLVQYSCRCTAEILSRAPPDVIEVQESNTIAPMNCEQEYGGNAVFALRASQSLMPNLDYTK